MKKIIDFHGVVHPYEMRGIRYEAEQFVDILDRYEINRAVITAPFYLVTDYTMGNRLVRRWVEKYPSRLIPFATINPFFEKEAIEELDRCADEGFSGVGEYHDDLMALPYDSTLSLKVLERAVKLSMPVLFHVCEHSIPGALKAAETFPEGKFVFAHIGGRKWREFTPLMRNYPNVYLCTSGTVWEKGYLESAVEHAGADRVIYGSDFVYIEPAICLGMIRQANLPEDIKEKILWKNAEKILGSRR